MDFQTEPSRYHHWKLSVEGRVATLAMDIQDDAGIRPGYKLKLNSYDLGVDIELHDALQRIRFEHPEVAGVILTSAKPRVFCSGANIYMLGLSSHAWKVSFCKFTNETRNGIEDSSAHSGLKFIAACNGSTAGGGYELALACEKRRVDDRDFHSALPEEPGVVARSQRRARRHGHASSFHCAEVRGGELRDIREYQQDSPFLLKPQREQPIADPVNLLSDLAISQPAVAADDRGFLRPSFPDVTVHEMVDEIVAALP